MPSKPKPPSDLADKFILRLPAGLRAQISASAKVNGRSMNSDILSRIVASFREDDDDRRHAAAEPGIASELAELKTALSRVEALCVDINRKVQGD